MKLLGNDNWAHLVTSPSPRKAWIETGPTWNVALETGGVLVGDEVTIDIEVELIRQEDQPALADAAAAS